jgi:hypothetical protein
MRTLLLPLGVLISSDHVAQSPDVPTAARSDEAEPCGETARLK